MKKITIAIDGFSSTGKSTLAKQLAKKLNYSYVDTGAMYRAIALYAMQNDLFHGESLDVNSLESALNSITIEFRYDKNLDANITFLNKVNVEQEIRGIKVSNKVSEVASITSVRRALVKQQKIMGQNKGVVMDGRDIGTVVFPNAELKIFMTADSKIRAKRRFDELIEKGEKVTLDEILKNLEKRDNEDRNRSDSPLIQAKDALILDNSNITLEEQFDKALNWALDKIN